MKNKVYFKKCLISVLVTSILLTLVFVVINRIEYDVYRNNFNNKLAQIVDVVKDKYPLVSEWELVNILNDKSSDYSISLEKYGIDISYDDIILDNEKNYRVFLVVKIIFLLVSFFVVVSILVFYIFNKDRKIKEITKIIEKINKKNYSLDIDSNSEDELSILKNELYKTTIMLKEQAENESKDKFNLKNSLEDISHQLKTPLTTIMISLDNLTGNVDMDKETRNKFISSINREVNNINFLVQSILKLSKFDANTIEFFRKEVLVRDIVNESVRNVSLLSDLKNVNIIVNGKEDVKLLCDSRWQIEGITNILKNALEYSSDGSSIIVNYEDAKVITKITINNKGSIISSKDLPNIFKRFYKGENSSSDSVGIGLALSKSIIEKDNGKIFVSSNVKYGTTFTIKYFKE